MGCVKLLNNFESVSLVAHCRKVFTVVVNLLTKNRSKFRIPEREDLWLFLTKLNIDNFGSIYQVYRSQ